MANREQGSLLTLCFRGVIPASGFLFSAALPGEAAIRERIVALWSPGATLCRRGDLYLLRLPGVVWVRAEEAPGAPLVQDGGLLCGAPGLGPEAARRGVPSGGVIFWRGGEIEVFSPAEGEIVDPSSWIDLGAFALLELEGASAPARPAPGNLLAPRLDVREAFGGKIPPSSAQARQIAAELARLTTLETPASGSASGPAVLGGVPELNPVVRWLGGMFQLLSAVVTRVALSSGSTPLGKAAARSAASPAEPPRPGLVVRPVEPGGPGFLERLSTRLNDWAARMLMASKMAPLVGRKQAEFLGNMMEMFERGNLDEALRHAIPLGGSGGGSTSFTLGVPGPRDALSLSVGAASGGTSVLPFAGLYDELRRIYRGAFERLDGQGRVEEAAFVLAELLQASEEAVAYLERHERLHLAAELAEGRKLAPGLVVRQWFLAGDARRGLLLARRHGAFADALVRLQDQPALGKSLLLLWADARARSGDFLGADRLLADLPPEDTHRIGRRTWLEQAIAQGGSVAFEARLRKLTLAPGSFEELAAEVQRLAHDPAPEAPPERVALASLMTEGLQGRPATLVALARPLLQAMLVDASRGSEPPELERLRQLLGGILVRADWPDAPPRTGPSGPLDLRIPAGSSGTVALLDAVMLPGGKALVALGEAGALLLSREGKRLHHFDQPAHELVLSTRGDRALALAPRGRAWRVARLDLVGHRSRVWCEVELATWAPDFDGASWLVGGGAGGAGSPPGASGAGSFRGAGGVGSGAVLSEIDALALDWSALWQIREPASQLVACWGSREGGSETHSAVFRDRSGAYSCWRFDASSRTLRGREDLVKIDPSEPFPPHFAGVPGGVLQLDREGYLALLSGGATRALPRMAPDRNIPCLRGERPGLRSHGDLFAFAVGPEILLWRSSSGGAEVIARVALEGATRSIAHPSPFGVALGDDRGRLQHLGFSAGRPCLLRSFRVGL